MYLVVGSAVLGASLLLARKAVHRHKRRAIPHASKQLPILGRIDAFRRAKQGMSHRVWEEICDEGGRLGAPFMQFSVLGVNTVMVTSAAAADAVLKKTGYHPKERLTYKGFQFVGTSTPALLELRDEAQHKRLRTEMGKFFCQETIDNIMGLLEHDVSRKCLQIATEASTSGSAGALVDTTALAADIIDGVITKALFETTHRLDLSYFKDTFVHLGQLAGNPMAFWPIAHGLSPDFIRYRRNWRGNHRQWVKLMHMVYNRPEEPDSKAFWMCLRRAFPTAMRDNTWDEALANAAIMYAAGTETTANAIANTLAALALDPATLQLLEDELSHAGLLATASNPEPVLPTPAELRKLPVLDAVFNEGLRALPPAPHGTMRELGADVEVDDVRVPKGSVLIMTPWGLHHSEAVWGQDAKRWAVGMWLQGRSAREVKRDEHGNLRWQPFGNGPQSCIGSHLATLETKVTLAMLVGRFKIVPDTKMRYKSADALVNGCKAFLTLSQKDGLHVRMQPRVPHTSVTGLGSGSGST